MLIVTVLEYAEYPEALKARTRHWMFAPAVPDSYSLTPAPTVLISWNDSPKSRSRYSIETPSSPWTPVMSQVSSNQPPVSDACKLLGALGAPPDAVARRRRRPCSQTATQRRCKANLTLLRTVVRTFT